MDLLLLLGARRAIACWLIGVTWALAGCESSESPPLASPRESPPGRWAAAPPSATRATAEDGQAEEIARLEAIGYVDAVEPAPARSGVVRFDPSRGSPGTNLYVSGHAPAAFLIDMEGRELHRWSTRFEAAFRPGQFDRAGNRFNWRADRHNFRRARLLPDGSLLAIFEGFGLVKLDRDSRLLWARPNRAHHDLHVAADGRIYVLTREARLEPRANERKPVLLDAVSILDESGREIDRISIFNAFYDSPYRARLFPVRFQPKLVRLAPDGDFMHTNTVEVLDGRLADRSSAFRAGNLLVSLREPSLVAVIDVETRRVVWCTAGFWQAPHDPTLVGAPARMLIFDNLGGTRPPGGSRVIEFDPFTLEIHWLWDGTPERPLNSAIMGSAARLPNGNTLITESQAGRVLEVTPGGAVVWEFLNPHRGGVRGELIAVVPELVRIGPDTPLTWLEGD